MPSLGKVGTALAALTATAPQAIVLKPYRARPDTRNEALFFLKPELTALSIDQQAVCELVSDTLDRFDVQIVASSVLNGLYLLEHDIFVRHYGVIDRVSRYGIVGTSQIGAQALAHDFAADLSVGTPVLGGHQIIEEFGVTAEALSALWDRHNNSRRIATGTYAARMTISGAHVIALNAFHPLMLKTYTAANSAIVVAVLRSPRPWRELRNSMIGTTDPMRAEPGALRRSFLDHRIKLRIPEISRAKNGVHMSAGPIEGFLELQRFFAAIADIAPHANLLAAATQFGTARQHLARLSSALSKELGQAEATIFERTEDMNMAEALTDLAQLSLI